MSPAASIMLSGGTGGDKEDELKRAIRGPLSDGSWDSRSLWRLASAFFGPARSSLIWQYPPQTSEEDGAFKETGVAMESRINVIRTPYGRPGAKRNVIGPKRRGKRQGGRKVKEGKKVGTRRVNDFGGRT